MYCSYVKGRRDSVIKEGVVDADIREGSATRKLDSRFKRFCQIFIQIRDSSQDLKYFKSLEYREILSLLAVNTEMLQRLKILPILYKI